MDIALSINNNEHDLIRACVRKERWAQQALYKEHYSSLMPICLRYTGQESEAMDLLHESFIKIFRGIH
ncbi:MAG: sigma factor, partial [Bacteroidota bacterium]